ncbi:hypothetical protein AB0N81_11390 [Streptomyces sp. NPDC093510]|uniref:hypothetical protein n=1 Tax=Streptomyces sp. NPDC093510 TaxID=3155199 RepID=UPI003430484D
MDWSSVVATVIGAAIGITATVIADRDRRRRELADRALEVRREAYASFMTAMNDAGEAIRAVSLGDHQSDAGRESATREAFRSAGAHAALERLRLVARPDVEAAAKEAFWSMRHLRDHYAAGRAPDDAVAYEARMELEENLAVLRGLMRSDLAATRPGER